MQSTTPHVFPFHLFGGNGNFHRPKVGQVRGHLQGAVAVLRIGDKIIEAVIVQIGSKEGVDRPQQGITAVFVIPIHHQTETDQIVDHGKTVQRGFAGARHAAQFLPHLPVAVDKDAHPPIDAGLFHQAAQLLHKGMDKLQPKARIGVHMLFDIGVRIRLGKGECQIFQPAAPLMTVEDARQFAVSADGFGGFLHLFGRWHVLQREQVVGFVRQFDQKDARIAEHAQFPQGFHLARAPIPRRREFGHPIHDKGYFFPQRTGEMGTDTIQTFAGVFHTVVKQTGNRPGFVSHQFVQKCAYPGAVGFKVRLAAHAHLPGMQFLPPAVSLGNGRRAWDKFLQFKLIQNARANLFDFLNPYHAPILP